MLHLPCTNLSTCIARYYRDPEQPAPEDAADGATLGPPRRVALDPEALLREAEEGVDDLDQVTDCVTRTVPWCPAHGADGTLYVLKASLRLATAHNVVTYCMFKRTW